MFLSTTPNLWIYYFHRDTRFRCAVSFSSFHRHHHYQNNGKNRICLLKWISHRKCRMFLRNPHRKWSKVIQFLESIEDINSKVLRYLSALWIFIVNNFATMTQFLHPQYEKHLHKALLTKTKKITVEENSNRICFPLNAYSWMRCVNQLLRSLRIYKKYMEFCPYMLIMTCCILSTLTRYMSNSTPD